MNNDEVRHDLEKQEAVVRILWDFAAAAQHTLQAGDYNVKPADRELPQLRVESIPVAQIMAVFGYRVVEAG